MRNTISKIIKILFPSYSEYRYYKLRNIQYSQMLKNLGYDINEKCIGEQKFINYWSKLTNRIGIYEYRLFSKYMGNVEYIIPDYIGTRIIEFYLNPARYIDFYEYKGTYTLYMNKKFLPITYITRINGGDVIYNELEKKDDNNVIDILIKNNINKFIFKPSIDTSSGKNVMMFYYNGNTFINNKGIIFSTEFLNTYKDFVIQELIEQHKSLAFLNPSSVNTLRICTYKSIEDENINVTGALIRIGRKGEIVDNAHAGGVFVGINLNTGELYNKAFDQYGNTYNEWNDINFNNKITIPYWNDVKDFCKIIASYNKHCRLLALDITIDKDGNPKLIEVNISGFSFWLFNFVGHDIFSGNTYSVINYCKQRLIDDGRISIV